MPLDSDTANADDLLDVRFYTFERDPHKGQVFVKIMSPGNQLNIVDVPATEYHKKRFAKHWIHFQMQNGDHKIPGIPLVDWRKARPDDVSEAQLTELGILKFSVVEQLAGATDAQLQRIGMGGVGLRAAAQAFVRDHRATSSSNELDETKKKLADLEAKMAAFMAAQSVPEKRPVGRPPIPKE